MTPRGLDEIKTSIQRLRDPLTPPDEVDRLARMSPAILWIAASFHGDEPSGTDASLRVLHELAARTDCVARRILDNAIVVILPVQNADRVRPTRGRTRTDSTPTGIGSPEPNPRPTTR